RFPATPRATLAARRVQLRGDRHEARPQRQGEVRRPARVLFGPARRRAGRRSADDARRSRRRYGAELSRRELLALLPPGARPLPGVRAAPSQHLSEAMRALRVLPVARYL